MKRLAPLLVALVVLVGAGGAEAKTAIVAPDARFPYQQWVDRAKAPTPDLTVTVRDVRFGDTPEPCGQTVLGCAVGLDLIYMAAFFKSWHRQVFLHELGHVFDRWALRDGDRARFLGLLGRPAWPWQTTGGEHFAESYRLCAERRKRPHHWRGTVAQVDTSARQLNATCRLISNAATRARA